MAKIHVNGAAIVDWPSFHDEFSRAFLFFDGYGRNADAWIDCMTDLHGPNSLSGLRLAAGEPVEIVLDASATLAASHPELLAGLKGLLRDANDRYAATGGQVRITLTEA